MKKIGINRTYVISEIVANREISNSDVADIFRKDTGLCWALDKNNLFAFVENLDPTKANFIDPYNPNFFVSKTPFEENKEYSDIVFDIALPYNKLPPNKLTELATISVLDIQNKQNFFNDVYESFSSGRDEVELLNYYIALSRDIRRDKDIERILTNNGQIDAKLLDNDNSSEQYFEKYAETFDRWRSTFLQNYAEITKNITLDRDVVDRFTTQNTKKSIFSKFIELNLYKDKIDEIGDSVNQTKMNIRLLSHIINNELKTVLTPFSFVFNQSYLSQRLVNGQDLTEVTTGFGKENLTPIDYKQWVEDSITNRQTDISRYFDFSGSQDVLYIGTRTNEEIPSVNDNIFLANLYSRVLLGKTNFIINKHLRSYKDILLGKKCYTEIIGFKINKKRSDNENEIIQTYYLENNKSDVLQFIDTQVNNNTKYIYDIYYYVAVLGNKYSYKQVASYEAALRRTRPLAPYPEAPKADEFTELNIPKNIEVNNEPLLYIFPIKATNLAKPFIEEAKETKLETVEITPIYSPPITPIVTPISFKDKRGKIRFNFQSGFDKYEDFYEIIDEEDNNILQIVKDAQNRPTSDNKITFETQIDKNGKLLGENYLIYKIDKTPLSYADFKNKIIGRIDNGITSFDDENLEFNKKYYYIFRSTNRIPAGRVEEPDVVAVRRTPLGRRRTDLVGETDAGGRGSARLPNFIELKSNPTKVYEVELVLNSSDSDYSNSGAYYAVIKLYEFPQESGAVEEKPFKQYIKIKPSVPQKLVPDIGTKDSTVEFSFGNVENRVVWGKKFKLRLTSKQTSRKIDINFRFNNPEKKQTS